MADDEKRIAVISPDGQFGTISAKHAEAVVKAGGRVLTKQEVAEKELDAQYAARSTGEKIAGALAGDATPTIGAWHRGGIAGLGTDLAQAAIAKGADAVVPGAGKAYAEQTEKLKTAHPTAYGAGEAVGMLGGAAAGAATGLGPAGMAARAIPGAGISTMGAGAEALVGLAGKAAGYEGASALGRAGMAAAEFGARGATEAAAYQLANNAGDAILNDVPMTTDKLFAGVGTAALFGAGGGAVLGGAGSLAASAVRGAATKIQGGLARVLAPAEEAAGEGLSTVKAATEAIANSEAAQPAAMSAKLKDWSNKLAADALGATKVQARNALEYVKGGAEAVGEYVNRIGIAKPEEGQGFFSGALQAGKSGRADELLEAIQADKAGRIATGLSEAVKGVPARVPVAELEGHANDLYGSMLRDPTQIAGADAFRSRVKLETQAIANAGHVAEDGTIDAAQAFYLRSDLAKQAYELGRASGAAGDAYKEFLRKWDATTIRALDEAAEKAGKSGVGDSIRHWKREWQVASAAEEMAAGGAERVAHNNNFGIREGIGAAVGIATGHPLMGTATLIGGKIAKERGHAIAAYTLNQLAERGTLTRWVQKIDDQIGKAAKGILQPPAKGLLKPADQMPATKALAKTAIARVAEFKADPESYIDKATRQSEGIGTHSPEIAQALVARQVAAMSFLAGKVPQVPDPDPMDPHPAPKMTPNEEAELGRYAWYVEKPARFFAEVARGRVTFEGAEVAKQLAPTAFEQLQQRTLEGIAEQMAKGTKLPYRQRQIIGVLMDVAATPSQRPDHAAFLQKNVSMLDSDPTAPAPKRSGPPVPSTQRSALDRLEADGPGRR